MDYNFFDLTAIYSYPFYETHKIGIEMGPSFSWGKNDYLTKLILSPSGDALNTQYDLRSEQYVGIVWGVFYDYKFPKLKVNIGLDLRWRRYNNDMPNSYNYGLHLGYNF